MFVFSSRIPYTYLLIFQGGLLLFKFPSSFPINHPSLRHQILENVPISDPTLRFMHCGFCNDGSITQFPAEHTALVKAFLRDSDNFETKNDTKSFSKLWDICTKKQSCFTKITRLLQLCYAVPSMYHFLNSSKMVYLE